MLQSKAAKATGKARTEARAARRSTSGQHKSYTHRIMGARFVSAIESKEAERYFDSLLVPESGSAQFPDLSNFPTVPIKTRFTVPLTYVVQPTSNSHLTVATFSPNLHDFYKQATAVDAAGAITWPSETVHPQYASLAANFACYRPISMCVRIHNTTVFTNKQGMCYTDLGSPVTSLQGSVGSFSNIGSIGDIFGSPTVKIGSFSQEYLKEVPRQSWVPARLNTNEFVPTDANPDSGNFISQTTDWPYIVIYVNHGTDDQNVQTLEAEIYFNLEAIPLYKFQYLYDARPCVGSPDKIAEQFIKYSDTLRQASSATVEGLETILHDLPTYGANLASGLNSAFNLYNAMSRMGQTPRDLIWRTLHAIRDRCSELKNANLKSESKEVNQFMENVKAILKFLDTDRDQRHLTLVDQFEQRGPWGPKQYIGTSMELREENEAIILSDSNSLKSTARSVVSNDSLLTPKSMGLGTYIVKKFT